MSPITISQPASARGFIPLTARSAASGRSVQYVGDANVDPFVNSEPNRSAITDHLKPPIILSTREVLRQLRAVINPSRAPVGISHMDPDKGPKTA